MKLDVQGYEDRVIRGGIETIKNASAVLTEISFERLYAKQPLFHDLYSLLYSLGFRLTAVVTNKHDASGIRIIQADAIFERCSLLQDLD
jgi:Methyltransferase FkbM domain